MATWHGLAGSLGIPYTRTTIAIIFVLILLLGGGLAWYQREELRQEWKDKRKYFLMIEGLFLAFFLFDLLIRIGNPDLWHPAKGGERPMDFSYFNAVIKSTSFPPYDPWFAGGYINYYYYGFVLVGTPVKLLGIVPSIAYNFILPTLFAIVGICAFSIGWNLIAGDRGKGSEDEPSPRNFDLSPSPLISGLAASAFTLFLGNLGTIQLIYQKLQQIGSAGAFDLGPVHFHLPALDLGCPGIFDGPQRHAARHRIRRLVLEPEPRRPSAGRQRDHRVPAVHIHLQRPACAHDRHAAGVARVELGTGRRGGTLATGGTSDRLRWVSSWAVSSSARCIPPIYRICIPICRSGMVALGYVIWRYADTPSLYQRMGLVVGAIAALTLLSFVMYEPYRAWYSQVYSALDPWKGPFTPIGSYLTHWSLLLFIVVSWMAWETHEWMAHTPVSALRKLKPYQLLIELFIVLIVLALLYLQYRMNSLFFPGVA